ncbi:MAG: pre-peptidase C-terminal domain-containing protein [Candidatus Thorarchaeota archaeon]
MRKTKFLSVLVLFALVAVALPIIGSVNAVATHSNRGELAQVTGPVDGEQAFDLQPFTTESYVLESAHNYANNYDNTWTITKTGATQIRVHFTRIDVEYGYDYVYVYDANNAQLHKLTGSYSSGGWTQWSTGSSIKVRLVTDYSVTRWGFAIDQIEYEGGGGGGGGGGGDHVLQSGVAATSSLSDTGATETWTIQVEANANNMHTVLTCGNADFDVYGRLGAAPTTSTYDWRGYTYGGEDVNFANPGAGTWYIMVRSYSGSGSYSLTVTISYNGGGGDAEKIAVFFWASDAGTQQVINEYKSVLQNEGYTKFFEFKDTTNFRNDFNQVAAYEDANDIVFFYLFGHGSNDGYHSSTAFAPQSSVVRSDEFRSMLDTLDSTKVGLVISSCHSGDWADDMRGGHYLAISSSDETHNSWAVTTIPGEERFANYFWNYVSQGYDAATAYQKAAADLPQTGSYVQFPKICNECTYNFFA